jgi:hypothetical protein
MITDYHAKYFAYELTKRCPSDSLEKLAGAVASAQVAFESSQAMASGAERKILSPLHNPLNQTL